MQSIAESQNGGDLDRFGALIHPDAQLHPVGGEPCGRDDVIALLKQEREQSQLRHTHFHHLEELGPTVGVALGAVRIPADRGFTHVSVAWAIELRDGLLFRAVARPTAREAHSIARSWLEPSTSAEAAGPD